MTELDQWLICGKPVDMYADDFGCSCRGFDPTEHRMKTAIARRRKARDESESVRPGDGGSDSSDVVLQEGWDALGE